MIWLYLAVAFVTIALFLFYVRQMKINAKMLRQFDLSLKVFESQRLFNATIVETLASLPEKKGKKNG